MELGFLTIFTLNCDNLVIYEAVFCHVFMIFLKVERIEEYQNE